MLSTALTEMFGLQHPIILGPMGGVAGGALAAAVSNAGGLGMVGGGYGDPAWLRTELSIVKRATQRPWGAGLITWAANADVLDLILEHEPEAMIGAKQRIVAANGDQTARTRVFDIVRGYPWPPRYTGRAIRNGFLERWHGREKELTGVLEIERVGYQSAARDGDCDTAVVWAGEAVDLIDRVERAAVLVGNIAAEAEAQLRRGARLVRPGHAAS